MESLGKELDLGVQMGTIDTPDEDSTTVVAGSNPSDVTGLVGLVTNFFPQGLTFGVARGTFVDATGRLIPRAPFLLRALAENRDISILANVPLWAQDNTEASVSVVEDPGGVHPGLWRRSGVP